MSRIGAAWRVAAAVTIATVALGCSTTPDTTTPGTLPVVGGSDGSGVTSTSVPSNSEGNIPANPGSVSEERPPSG